MALGTVEELVRGWLPWLPAATIVPAVDTQIDLYKISTYYFLQSYLGIADADVEDDGQYNGVTRLLVAALVANDLMVNKVLLNVGGTSSTAPSGGKRIKKAKADVVEAEFDYAKASDGNSLLMSADKLMALLKEKICIYGSTLNIWLPMCMCDDNLEITPFKAYVNCD